MIWVMLLTALAVQDDGASARAEADAIIAAAEAQGVFENVTTETTPALRHVQSGLICHFTPGEPANFVRIYPILRDGLVRGDDVGCNTRGQGMNVTIYATRYAHHYSETLVLEDAVAAIRQRWPEAQAYEGSFPLFTSPDREAPPLHTVFNVTVRDAPHVTFVLVQHQGEWSYKLRGTREGDDVMRAGMTGSMMLMNALGAVGAEP